jgi:hypothetical protein
VFLFPCERKYLDLVYLVKWCAQLCSSINANKHLTDKYATGWRHLRKYCGTTSIFRGVTGLPLESNTALQLTDSVNDKVHEGRLQTIGAKCAFPTGYTVCPTRYRTRHFFNNFTTNEDIATKFEADLPHCVRNFSHNERTPVQISLQYLHWC